MRNLSRSRNSHSGKRVPARVSARKHPQQERSLATVDAVLEAASHVLVKVGYDRATTGLIAEAAGVSVGSIYQYFPNKDSVFNRLLERELDGLVGRAAELWEEVQGESLEVQVEGFVRTLLEHKSRNPKLSHVLKTELGRLDGSRLVRKMNLRYLELVEAALRSPQHGLDFRDWSRVAFLIVNAVDGVVNGLLLESPEALADRTLVFDITKMVVATSRALSRR
jgi:AcrR family transcriptional regulator